MSWDVVGGAVNDIVMDVLKVFSPAGAVVVESLKEFGGPSAPPPPPPPAPLPPGAEGSAAEAANENARRIGQTLEHLATLDQSGVSTEDIAASGEVGRKALEDIRADVTAKIEEMKSSGALYTPAGQLKLGEYIKVRLEEARGVIEQAAADAEAKAAQVNEQAERYKGVGNNGAGGGSGGDGGGHTGGTSTEEANTGPAGLPTMGMPLGAGVPGLGGGLPGLGGGGMPGLGGGLPGSFMDPLSGALGNLGQGAPEGPDLALPEETTGDGDGEDGGGLDEGDEGDGHSHDEGVAEGEGENQQTEPAATVPPLGEQPSDPELKPTEVRLPSGDVTEARSAHGVQAVQAALNGDPVSAAYEKTTGITLPPPGTPVTEPVPPRQLMAGDVGMWEDHLVMALGNEKVLVSGQEQPLSSVGTGPDFLGWFDPMATRGNSGPGAD
ncbi:MAG: DUF4226 domain-containing protein [Actinomycetia bacterium]|nr:DUF4226 domain-containing protein [Actinomycetes bacterium]